MKIWTIPVSWEVADSIQISALTLDEPCLLPALRQMGTVQILHYYRNGGTHQCV